MSDWGQLCFRAPHASSPATVTHFLPPLSSPSLIPNNSRSKPAVKQYSGTGSICGVGVDLNFY